MKTGICDARKRIFSQIALSSLFLLCISVGNAWSDDSMPTAKTRQVSNVTSSSATLKGTVYSTNPSRNVYYSFQWGTTTSYENQTRNQSAGISADRPDVEVTEELTNLSPNTTYYYRLAVSDGQGQVYGEGKIFTTYVPPTVTTDTATNVTSSTATLIGTANPNGIKTSVCFYYGSGSGEVNTRKQDVGSGTSPLSASATISNLRPGTTYYYRMEASSSGGTVSGPQMSFTTPALLPSVSTDDATNVANHTATLNGTINPHETNVSYYFQWGPNENPSAYKTHIRSAGSGSEPVKVSATVGGLKPGTSYYYTILADYNYRIGGVESRGQANGENRTFTTLISPGAATMQATNITSNSVTLNATVTPNGLPTEWYFEIRKFLFFTTWKRIGTREEPVTQNWNASVNIPGLDPDSTYRFRIVAKSIGGTVYGPEMNFKTLPFAPPIVTTGPAYNITKNSATLEGIVNPRGSPVSYWFQYGPTDSYGKYSTGQSGVAGASNATVSVTINGLIPKTTYHYRLMASSVKGPVYGLDKTFTTPFSPQDVATGVVPGGTKTLIAPSAKPMVTAGVATKIVSVPKSTVTVGTATKVASASNSKPTVTTGTATKVASTLATIHGTVNPNGSATTYYFEYGQTPSYGNKVPISPQSAGSGAINVNVSADISGKFTPTNTYHYRIVATNKSGTSHGEDKSFTIPSMLLPAIKNISPAPASKSVTGAHP